jgi:two-component system cell cycle sensor histidine kinase/response regulator CckA
MAHDETDLFDLAPDACLVTAPDGRIQLANLAAGRMFRCAPLDLRGASMCELVPEGDEAALSAFLASLAGDEPACDRDLRIVAGGAVPLPVSVSVARARVVAGLPVALLWTLRDATGRLQREDAFRREQEQLRLGHAMDAVSRLAGSVGDDLARALAAIKQTAEGLLAGLHPDDSLAERARGIARLAEGALAVTRQLGTTSAPPVGGVRVMDLNARLGEVEPLVRRMAGPDVKLALHAGQGVARVKADPTQVERIFSQLAAHAREVMPRGGRLVLETLSVDVEPGLEAWHPGVPVGRWVLLAATETPETEPITPVILHAMPQPVTRGADRPDLPLAAVHALVRQAGGHTRIDHTTGEGVRVKIYLPRVESAVALRSVAPRPEAVRAAATVMVVEDDWEIRTFAASALRWHGYTVLEAADGAQAVEVLRQHRGRVDVLVSDVLMPRMNGPDLARYVATDHPDLRVLYISAYSGRALSTQGLLSREAGMLEKPFTTEQLVDRVAELLCATPQARAC